MGIVRPTAAPEIWSYAVLCYAKDKKPALAALLDRGEIVPVEVEGMKGNATPGFLALLDQPPLDRRVAFIAPLDQLMWDRKMTAHIFDFDYSWEIYTPEAKRRWGYYVLPVLFGNELVARAEFYCRDGVLELRQWHFESSDLDGVFTSELELALRKFMRYCSATKMKAERHIDKKIRDLSRSLRP